MGSGLKRSKISTANLKVGMYVAQLDRPWLETPFLFQGFEIREDGELKLLRQFCRHVYIDVTRCSLPKDMVLQALQTIDREKAVMREPPRRRPATLAGRIMRAVTALDPTGVVAARLDGHREYRNTVPTRKEAPQAIRAYDAAMLTVQDMVLRARAKPGIDFEQLQACTRPIVDSILRNQDAMAWLVYLRRVDEYVFHHSIASAVWAVILGRHLGFDRHGLDTLAIGGLLLDIGKAKLPAVMTTRAGKLTASEYGTMQKHVGLSLDVVRLTPGINADVLAMIEGHHERHDGSGYPKGLRGSDIPVFARIGGLVDCYDAMTSPRPWAAAKSPYDAIRELNTMAGVQFQKEMVEQFVQALGMFPTGSLVEINTGEAGIVVEQNRIRRLRPKVMLVLDADKQPLVAYRVLDLGRCPSNQNEANAHWIVRGHEAGAFGLDPKNYFIG
jgi:HD-GYP domain-containing protein (c-di-GMP phosphodiesterase class II)